MAAIVTKAPLRSNSSSSRGMAAISLDLPSTATWPRLSPAWVAQTLTRWSMPRPRACEPDEHKALPSMAMWSMPRADADAGAQPAPQAEVQAARRQRGEDALEGAARGDAVGQVQEGREPAGALRGEGDDLGPVVGPGDGGAQGDGDDAEQRVVLVAVAAAARVAQALEAVPDGDLLAVHDFTTTSRATAHPTPWLMRHATAPASIWALWDALALPISGVRQSCDTGSQRRSVWVRGG